jgi:hydroxymethylglutaryl-CoA reductase (NADPH)
MDIDFRLKSLKSAKEKINQRQNQLSSIPEGTLDDLFSVGFNEQQIELISNKNCENMIGSIEIPVGISGPITINGDDFLVPLATSEGALIASVSRGIKALNESGGVAVFSKKIGMTRAPVFRCTTGMMANRFNEWLEKNKQHVFAEIEKTSNHLIVLGFKSWVRGRHIFVRFECDTDQAMGMNMVTIGIEKMWQQIKDQYKNDDEIVGTELVSISGNVCSDKKDSVVNRLLGRGYWVQAEAMLSEEIVKTLLKSSADQMEYVHVIKNLVGSNIAGSQSQNMQAANVAAAFFAATGQDLAHVVEASQVSTTIEVTSRGLYVAVTAPNINLGVVGGGTWLPAQQQARSIIFGNKEENALVLAEVLVATILAAEVSGIAALASNSLGDAHQKLGRLKEVQGVQ